MATQTFADHYKLTHRFVSAGIYSYEEILEMLPYERDIFFTLAIDDAHNKNRASQTSQSF